MEQSINISHWAEDDNSFFERDILRDLDSRPINMNVKQPLKSILDDKQQKKAKLKDILHKTDEELVKTINKEKSPHKNTSMISQNHTSKLDFQPNTQKRTDLRLFQGPFNKGVDLQVERSATGPLSSGNGISRLNTKNFPDEIDKLSRSPTPLANSYSAKNLHSFSDSIQTASTAEKTPRTKLPFHALRDRAPLSSQSDNPSNRVFTFSTKDVGPSSYNHIASPIDDKLRPVQFFTSDNNYTPNHKNLPPRDTSILLGGNHNIHRHEENSSKNFILKFKSGSATPEPQIGIENFSSYIKEPSPTDMYSMSRGKAFSYTTTPRASVLDVIRRDPISSNESSNDSSPVFSPRSQANAHTHTHTHTNNPAANSIFKLAALKQLTSSSPIIPGAKTYSSRVKLNNSSFLLHQ